jgi:nucleotidyltransferase/DNA polymerase involved in DNA repair
LTISYGTFSYAKNMTTSQTIKELSQIPGVGKSIAADLLNIGINSIGDLKGKDPQQLYDRSNQFAGCVQDRCLLYVFRCAVYFAETPTNKQDGEKLKWWNWEDENRIRK